MFSFFRRYKNSSKVQQDSNKQEKLTQKYAKIKVAKTDNISKDINQTIDRIRDL